jgi:hypothetical protein
METKETHYKEMKDWQDGARRLLVREMEQLNDEKKQLNERLRYLDATGELLSRIEDLNGMLTDRQAEVRLSEMSKLTAGMAKKTPEEDLLKALRTYVNRSKRKTPDKRAIAKMATLEIANANGLVLPEDLAAAIESLDDEQAEPKVIKVNGNYNDVHHFHGDIDKLTISSE